MARLSNITKAWISTIIAVLYIGAMTALFSMGKMDTATYLTVTAPATALLFTDLLKERKK